jgi:hypothetical protein
MTAELAGRREAAPGMIALLKGALAAVRAEDVACARRMLNEEVIRIELVGVPPEIVVMTVEIARRAVSRLSADPPQLNAARIELRQLLRFWLEGWKS